MAEAQGVPALGRAISGTRLAASEDFACCICCERLVDPVTVECGHTFCRHCISTCFGQVATSFREDARPTVPCPRCRASIAVHYEVSERVVAAMREQRLLAAQRPGACVARAATVNRFDGNRTETDGEFDLVFVGSAGGAGARADEVAGELGEAFEADVVWSTGTVHSTYRETTCRVRGRIASAPDGGTTGGGGGFRALTARAEYSNGPWEEWSGRVVQVGPADGDGGGLCFELRDGEYVWHGWNGRVTRGRFELSWRGAEPQFSEVS